MKINIGHAVEGDNFFGRKKELKRMAEIWQSEAAKKILAHTCGKSLGFDDIYPFIEDILEEKAAVNKLLKRLVDECYLKKDGARYGFVSPMLADWWTNHYDWEK